MKTRMTELLGIQHPVMCGGMMWLAKPGLCAAISEAGGLGNLTAGNYDSEDAFREAVKETQALTGKPFSVNITLMPSVRITKELHDAYFRVCCEEHVAAIEISGAPVDRYFGPEAMAQAKQAGVKLIHKLGSVKHALHAQKAGYDAVIAAGFEEGGHPLDEDVTTMLLTPRLSESLDIPVITTGGIADGRGMAAAIVLGADGVMMASRFIASDECLAHLRTKEHLVERQENDTTLICKSLRLQMRVLKNEQASKVHEVEARKGGLDEILPLLTGETATGAWESGDVEHAPLAVGQSIGLIKQVLSCRDIIEGMVREAEACLAQAQQRIQG